MSEYTRWTRSTPDRPTFVVWLAIAVGINMLALIVVDAVFGGVAIGRWGPLVVAGLVLAIGNTFLKPVVALLTLPLIVVTLGIGYFAINVAMLALAEWVTSDFVINGFWTYVGATILIWLVNVVMQAVLGSISGQNMKRPGPRR
ncbi:MAG: phage holin family protein [Gaiellales bacterium]